MPKIVDKQAKKRAIVEAALRVFAKQGANHAKISEIAEAAGMGKGTIYEYYKSKEAIFQDTMLLVFETVETTAAKKVFNARNPAEKIKEYCMGVAEGATHFSDTIEFFLDFWAAGSREEQIVQTRQAYDLARQRLIDYIEEGIRAKVFKKIDAYAVASAIFGMLDGILLQYVLDREFPYLETVQTTVALLLEGMQNNSD